MGPEGREAPGLLVLWGKKQRGEKQGELWIPVKPLDDKGGGGSKNKMVSESGGSSRWRGDAVEEGW